MKHKDVLKQVRKLVAQIVDGKADPKSSGEKAIKLIDDALAETGRGEADVQYVVEDSVNGPVLTERRAGGRTHPFRCPKSVYDAMVNVLADLDHAVPLDEIVAGVQEELSDRPADYQVRVALRLWMHVEPPLLLRNRARYKTAGAVSFESAARTLWKTLRLA